MNSRKKISLVLLISALFFVFFYALSAENLIALNIITKNTYNDNLFNHLYLLDSFFHSIFFIGIYLIVILYSKEKFKVFKRFNVCMVTILYLITILVPFMTYNIQAINMNGFIKFIVLLFAIYEINVKDKDNIRVYHPIVEIINALYMIIFSLVGLIVYPIMYVISFFTKREIKTPQEKINGETLLFKLLVGTLAIVTGFGLFMFTFILLGATDSSFFESFDSLHIFRVLLELLASLLIGFIFASFIYVYDETENKYHSFILPLQKINHKYANYNWVSNIIMGFLIPGYLLFITYEYAQLLDPEKMTGNIAYYGYFSISFVVFLNIILILSSYYFYNKGHLKSMLLRVFVLVLNLLLLGIGFAQIYLLTFKYYSLTHPRYYAIITIIFFILLTLILILKTINLKININKPLIIILLFIYSLFFLIDIDTILYEFNTSYQEQADRYYDEAYLYTLDPRWIENKEKAENPDWDDSSNPTIADELEKNYCFEDADEDADDWMCADKKNNKDNH